MSRNYSEKAKQKSADAPRKRGTGLYLAVAGALLVISVLALVNKERLDAPAPPEISFEGLDPAIAAMVRTHIEQVKRGPKSAEAWGELGMVYMIYDYQAQAEMCLGRAEQLNPENPRWSYYISYVNRTDDLQRSLEKLEESVEKDRGKTVALELELANRYADGGRFNEADDLYQAVLDRDPGNVGALLGRGKLAYASDALEESRQLLEQSAQSPFTARQSASLLGTVYFRLGDEEKSESASQAASRMPEDLSWPNPFLTEASKFNTGKKAWTDAVNQLTARNQFQEILPWAQKLIEHYPEAEDGWKFLGRVRMSESNYPAAEEAYRNAAERSATSVEARIQLGLAILNQRRFEDAIPPLKQVLQLKPDLGEAWYNLGFCQGMTGDTSAAIESFRSAIEYNPQLFLAYLRLAELCLQQDNKAEAASVLSEAEKINPADPTLQALRKMLQAGTTP